MIDPGPTTLGLDIATASVNADPGLLSADPGMMATAARNFGSAAHQIEAAGRASSRASAQLSTNWWGKGKQGFDAASSKANSGASVAAYAMAGASAALMTLSVQISAAQSLAKQAMAQASDSTQEASALQSAYAASAQHAVQALPAGATPEQVLAAQLPTAAQAAQASAISAVAAAATDMMAQANTMARQAWNQAASTFDAVTAQAPSVQAAVAAARTKAADDHQGGGILGGILNLGGAVLLGMVDGGADVATDGAATPLDGADAGEISDLAGSGIADLTGASDAEIAAAEEEGAANAVVDGERLGGQVAEDATNPGPAGPENTTGAGTALTPGDLSGAVQSNYGRFLKSLPSGADDPTITRLPNGEIQFDAKVPATNVPGSYATYTKVVSSDGTTSTFYKTTYAPDGSVVHVKVKYP